MKIGIVTEWFERGSAYVSKQISESLEAEGWEVHIYARGEHRDLSQPLWGGKYVWEGAPAKLPLPKPVNKYDFERWLLVNNFDLILFNEQISLAPVLWAKAAGIPTVAYIDYYTRDTVKDFKVYDALICNTQRHFQVFSWHPAAHFIPWGTDVDVYTPRHTPSPRPFTFFHSAGWSPERKGTDLVIRAFEEHLKLHPESKLVLHSQADLSRLFPDLGPTIARLEKQGSLNINFETVGAPGLYHLGDVYVYPSRLDGIGLTIAESLSSGLRLITTDEDPMSEFAKAPHSLRVSVASAWERDDGYYWPMVEPDLKSLVSALDLAAGEKSAISTMREDIRQYATSNLDWRKNSIRMARMLQQVSATTPINPTLFDKLRLNATTLQYEIYRLAKSPLEAWSRFRRSAGL